MKHARRQWVTIRVNGFEFFGLATVFRQNVRNDRSEHAYIARQQRRCGSLAAGQRNALSRVGRMAPGGRTKMPAPKSAAGIASPREAVRAQSGAISTPDAAWARSMIGETPEWTLWAIVGLLAFIALRPAHPNRLPGRRWGRLSKGSPQPVRRYSVSRLKTLKVYAPPRTTAARRRCAER